MNIANLGGEHFDFSGRCGSVGCKRGPLPDRRRVQFIAAPLQQLSLPHRPRVFPRQKKNDFSIVRP
jgi:hypothetical protein